MKAKKNSAPVIGANGDYCFRYNQGAKYEIKTGATVATYEIVCCFYESETQTYGVGVESGGVKKYREMTIERLNYLFENAENVKELSCGNVCELPITETEVRHYYTFVIKARNKRRREANAKLKDDKDYQKLLAESKELAPKWAQAICNGRADEKDLEAQMLENARKKREIMDKLGVRLADLETPETCEYCDDKGITPRGMICTCAYAQADKIKAFCGAERFVERQKEVFLNESQDS